VRNSDAIPDLARDLISRGGTVLGRIAVDAHEARGLVQVSPEAAPVEFVIDLPGLERFIEAARDSAPDVFPDVDGIEGPQKGGSSRSVLIVVARPGTARSLRRSEPPCPRATTAGPRSARGPIPVIRADDVGANGVATRSRESVRSTHAHASAPGPVRSARYTSS
jgi:hypothetical protein